MRHRCLVWFFTPFLLFTLIACQTTDPYVSGHPITPEELASISKAVFSTEPPDPIETSLPIETLPDADSYPEFVVHWTAGGKVYHDDHTCYHLSRANTVYHGTVDNAALAGKEKLCSYCEKRNDETLTDAPTTSKP